jgi:uncharacterized protein with PIN domain
MKKSKVIEDMQKEILALKEAKDKKKEEKDEDVCPECGGDLEYVEEGVVLCPKCKVYYEVEEDGE